MTHKKNISILLFKTTDDSQYVAVTSVKTRDGLLSYVENSIDNLVDKVVGYITENGIDKVNMQTLDEKHSLKSFYETYSK